MTKEFVFLELSYSDVLNLAGLIPKEKYEWCTYVDMSAIKNDKSSFGKLGRVKRSGR
jgi:hypothetical protein